MRFQRKRINVRQYWITVLIVFYLSLNLPHLETPTRIKLVLSRNNTLERNSRGRDVTGSMSEIDGMVNPADLA